MRGSPIRGLLEKRGAQFRETAGREIPCGFSTFEEEYAAVRKAVGLTDFSYTVRYRVPEDALDVFERYATGSVANIRFGRILHTMAVDDDGMLENELYIANDDDKLLLIGEAVVSDEAVSEVLTGLSDDPSSLEDMSSTHALFGIDGFHAWAVVKDLFGSDVLGLPYMSIENYEIDGIDVKLFRAGKTSEFGYLLMVSADSAESLWLKIEAAGEKYGLKPVGFDTHMALRLDGRFFNIHREGAIVRDPLPLGLQWMIDLDADTYRGKEALLSRRDAGLSKKLVGVVTEGRQHPFSPGDKILYGGQVLGEMVTTTFSPVLGTYIGLALVDIAYAFAGLQFQGEDGKTISTVSLPPFTAKSLTVRLDEM